MTRLKLHPEDKKAMLRRYLAEGFTKAQIARSLQINPRTVGVWFRDLGLNQEYQQLHYPTK